MGFRLLGVWLVAMLLQGHVDQRSGAAFVRTLQAAVARNDRAAVAQLIRYPLTVFAGGVRVPITDAADLVNSYDAVFSPALRAVIANAALPRRGFNPESRIDVSADRVTIAGDAVEIEPVGGRLLITGIHAPLGAASAGAKTRGQAGAREPRRIAIRFGRIEHPGVLGPGQRDQYVLAGRRNQVLEVRITGVKGRDVVCEIVNARTRTPVDAKVKGGVRNWVGRIPEDGDYRLDVVRLAAAGAPQLPYTLIVSLR